VLVLADFWSFTAGFVNLLVLLLSIFLILLVLIQRGKGGGLTGALAGTGSSAFGSRAGDTFTRITIGVAAVWILLLMVEVVAIQKTKMSAEEPTGTFANTEQTK